VSQATRASQATATPKFKPSDLATYRGYHRAALSWLQYGTAIGAVYFVVGPLIAGMLPDVEWSIGVVSDALLVRGLLGMGTAPLTGWLVARYGVRPVVMVGGLLTAGFTALTGTVSNIVHNWFMDRHGVVMGFVNSGAGFGGLIFSPLMALLIRDFRWCCPTPTRPNRASSTRLAWRETDRAWNWHLAEPAPARNRPQPT
jgi:MFS family permease